MARKDLLKGLMSGDQPPAPATPRASYNKGAIGAVSRSISELKSRSVIEVPADLIDDTGGLKDRLGEESADHAALVASIRDYGQQVPVLLRHDPNHEGRYQIVYGRRRVAALKELGQPVKALLRDLNDHDLILAQGQENSARRDLTFIEKTNFARQMQEAGFARKLICDALHIDKTVISRMLSVADALGGDVIRAIGPAPSIGRDRWQKLAAMVGQSVTQNTLRGLLVPLESLPSDARFEALLKHLTDRPAPKPKAPAPLLADGKAVGQITRNPKAVTLKLDDPGFGDWLADNISQIHRDWVKSRGDEQP